jgi:hypothetical protein
VGFEWPGKGTALVAGLMIVTGRVRSLRARVCTRQTSRSVGGGPYRTVSPMESRSSIKVEF